MADSGTAATVALLTDFGTADGYAAAMKGVIRGINPGAVLVDISHQVPPHDIEGGGYVLADVYRYFPAGTVFLVVIDPRVGGEQPPIAVSAGPYRFVGPDNGVFTRIYRLEPEVRVNLIQDRSYFLSPTSDTFHGRDIFAPVAAHLSLGLAPDRLGPRLTDYVRIGSAGPVLSGGKLSCQVVYVDRFGNLITDLDRRTMEEFAGGRTIGFRVGSVIITGISRSYSDVGPGEPLAVIAGAGTLEIAVNRGSAAELTGTGRGAVIELEISPERKGP